MTRRRDPRQFVAGLVLGVTVMASASVAARTRVPWAESGRVSLAAPALVAQRAPWACRVPADPSSCARVAAGVLEMIGALSLAQRPSVAVVGTLSAVNVDLGGDPLIGVLGTSVPTLAPGPSIAPPVDYSDPTVLATVPTTKALGGCIRSDTGGPC